MPAILETLDTADSADEGAVELSQIAGHVFGPTGASLFLTAVAAGSDPLAAEVAEHLAKLQEHASSADQPARPGVLEPSLPDLTERTRKLTDQGMALAGALRAAADEAEAGRPITAVSEDLARWSAAVRQHLADAAGIVAADSLTALGTGLGEMAARTRSATVSSRRRFAARACSASRASAT